MTKEEVWQTAITLRDSLATMSEKQKLSTPSSTFVNSFNEIRKHYLRVYPKANPIVIPEISTHNDIQVTYGELHAFLCVIASDTYEGGF